MQVTDNNYYFPITGWRGGRLGSALRALSWTAVFGSLFIFSKVYALSLHNIQVNSALGEPLDAIVTVNASPGEQLQATCISTSFNEASGMPGISGVQLSLTRRLSPGTLRLRSASPVNEPMSEIVVKVNCPGAPAVTRTFLIMLDPRGVQQARNNPAPVESTSGAESAAATPAADAVIRSTDARVRVRSRQVTVIRGVPIPPGSRYEVANGDALSVIAARIEGRDYGTVWSWAATIQAANPHAFINGNPNELIAGSQLYIPGQLAAGTAALTVPAPGTSNAANDASVAAASAALSRYENRFSTRTGEPPEVTSAVNGTATVTAPVTTPTPVTVPVDNVGTAPAIQPMMVMATSFSSVSQERLRQRERGVIQVTATNLPDFVSVDGNTAANDAQAANQPAPEPAPAPTDQRPTEPIAAKPEAAAPSSRFSWFGSLAGLGLLLSAFFAGWWLSRRRSEAELAEQVEARLNEERYRERVRSGRQDVIRAGMGSAGAGIQVTETGSRDTREVKALSEDDLDEIVGAALKDEQPKQPAAQEDAQTHEAPDQPLIDPSELEIDPSSTHELDELDLELLERDYATQTETNTNLEEIAEAGRGGDKTAANAEPVDDSISDPQGKAFDTLEFDPRTAALDFDIGADVEEADDDKTEALGLDLEEAGASIDAHLEELKRQDTEWQDGSLDKTSTTEMANLGLPEELEDLPIEQLLEGDDLDDETPTRDAEEFYHLEASSIMNVGELDFEKGPDDETNILRFRQRNIRTGTDDSSPDEE